MSENCDRCKRVSDRDHILRCPSCMKSYCTECIIAASKAAICCPGCKKSLIICPTCLRNRKIARLKIDDLSCKCGFKLKR